MLNLVTSLYFMLFLQTTPAEVVQKQLDTYNARDIQGFMSVMSDDVALFELSNTKASAAGFAEVKSIYTQLFNNSPALHSNLLNRMVMGNKVVDHERITGRNGLKEAIELVVIYELNDKMKINRITVLRP